jgi:hypothetical protein
MATMLLPFILSFARHGLTVLAGVLVGKGVISSGQEGAFVEIIAGVIAFVIGQGSSLILAAKKR